jgi:hypothetical protein
MDVRLPDGTVIQGVPDNITKAELTAKLARNGYDVSQLGGAPNSDIDPNIPRVDVVGRRGSADTASEESHGLLDTLTAIPGHIKEALTGDDRTTKEISALPEHTNLPEFGQVNWAAAKTALGTILANPAETVKIIQANFPDVKARQDDKGNFILRSGIDGKEYAIKPGFQVSDIPRALAGIAAFTPAGRATTLGGAAAGAAGTQALIEGSQAATGGEFNPGEVAMAGVAGAAVPAVVQAVRAAAAPVRQLTQRVRGVPNPVSAAESAAADPLAAAAAGADAAPPAAAPAATPVGPAAAAAEPAATMGAADLASTARKAAEGGLGSKNARQVLAEQAAPDAKVVDAAKRLGIDEYLQPDHVTTNQAFRELSQAVKSIPGSEARAAELEGLEGVAQRADKLIEEIGGTHDISRLNSKAKATLEADQNTLTQRAESLYEHVKAAIPPKTEVSASNTMGFLKAHADELGGAGRLLPTEKKLLGTLAGDDGPLTYAFLDQTRKQIGQAMRKATGPFADSESGILKRLYGTLSDDQNAVAQAAGVGDLYGAAKAAVAVRKGVEDDLAALFGKNLDESFAGDLSGAVRALPSGDPSKLIRLLKSIPEGMRREVVASGLNTAFGKSIANNKGSFARYATWYEGLLKNKQAYTAIMTHLEPSARKQLSDLYRVSRSISAATKERITTGRINAIKDELKPADHLGSRLYAAAKHQVVAVGAGTVAGGATGVVAGPAAGAAVGAAVTSALSKGAKTEAIKAVDKLIISPEFVELAKKAAAGSAPEQRRATLRLVHSAAWKRFAHAAKQPINPTAAERWVTQALQNNNQQR